MDTVYLDIKDVPATLRGNYTGRKFAVKPCASFTVPADAGIWYHGSRDTFSMIDIATGKTVPFPCQNAAPWDTERKSLHIDIPTGLAIVEHSYFCGKDFGLTIYANPVDVAPLLPAPTAELTRVELIVIDATCSYKASYNGMNRYDMALNDYRYKKDSEPFPTLEQWNVAKQALISLGYLNKAGAITTKGRNSRPARY